MSLGVVAFAAVAGVASSLTDHLDDIALGCPARTEEEQEHWPYANFSLAEHLGKHGTLQVVACIVQGWDQVLSLKGDADLPHFNAAPFVDNCIAIGSSCGTPCGFYAGHSDTCNTTTMTINPEYLYNENAVQNHTAGHGFSTRHVVSIKNRKSQTEYPMDACEPCDTYCTDSNWQSHCKAGGKDDSGLNCNDWKCKDPPEDDDDDEPEVTCNERWKCGTILPSGLKIDNLSVQAEFNEDDMPPADKGVLYSVIFAGTNLQTSSGTAQPPGSWQLIYTPRETEALQRDLVVV